MTAAAPAARAVPARAGSAATLLAVAEVLFAVVGLVTVVSLRRVFEGADWFAPLALHVLAAHGTATVLRRRRLPTAVAVGLATAIGLTVIGLVHAAGATTYGLPTPGAIEALVDAVVDAFAAFSDVKAPVAPEEGFLVATAVAVWAGAIVGDWAAFRADAAVEAVLPAAALFGVASVLGADVDRAAVSGAWIAAVLAFVLVRRAERLGRRSTWAGERRARGPRALVTLGLGLAVVAALLAAVVGPRLPGADAEGVVSLTDLGDDDPGTRVTVSPLVDIRSRLVQQADVEVFTVRSDVRSYWRLTSLETFDGAIWKSNGSYGRAAGGLDAGVPVAAERILFDQRFEIGALSQIWLPAAYEPRAIDADAPVRYDEASGTLIVDAELPTSDGTAYVVRSALPQHDPTALAAASREIPDDIAEAYLQLPEELPVSVRQLAAEITAGSTSPYESALRLQDHLRTNFTYDIAVDLGHGVDDLASFLFTVQAGYCEQFAGAFAAMARSLGIPARVAVGFTPGVPDPADPSLHRVRGEHAHAWPEVYLGEHGWVPFEPTPGRGAPFAEQHTGVPEQQAASGGDGGTATTVAPEQSPAPATPTTAPGMSPPTFPDQPELGGGAAGGDDEDGSPNPWPARIAIALAVVVAAGVLYLLGVLAASSIVRWQRRRRATTPVAQVALAWDEALAAARRAGAHVPRSATQAQAAARIGERIPVVDAPIRSLADTVEAAAYAPAPPDEELAGRARAMAEHVEAGARSTMDVRQRFRTRFDPRQLRRR